LAGIRKIEVTSGVFWIEVPDLDLRILCACPADAVKHLMKRGLIRSLVRDGMEFETGPNAILLSDLMVQNGAFANLAEFPVLQMLYRQGMIVPGHPGNTGQKPLLIGSADQVAAQMHYIHRGNYGLLSEGEMMAAGLSPDQARDLMRLKLRFAFGAIREPSALLDTLVVGDGPVAVRGGLTVRRLALNVFEFALADERVRVDLGLDAFGLYECPYPLGFYYIPRAYFAVVHCGEGDGWDINRPCMGSIVMFQGRIYLVDAGPNVLAALNALGIGINEIEGIFHTHSHDDHFAGLTTLIRADHRLKYYAAPLVAAAVARKFAALLSADETVFGDYFDVHLLECEAWNDIEGLEVRPIASPHPVETTFFLFRALWEDGYRTYAHLADICGLDVLAGFVTDDPGAPGLSADSLTRIAAAYAIPADVKKIDIGGGLIHGDARDFQDDRSHKIIFAHTALPQTAWQRAIGSAASFGTVDVLIPSDRDLIWRAAYEVICVTFPDLPQHQLRLLINNPLVSFNPGSILVRAGEIAPYVWLILAGSVEAISADGCARTVLSAGALVGEESALFASPAGETCRAQGFVKTLKISRMLYSEIVRRNALFPDIARLLDRRAFLRRTWLFGEVVSSRTLDRIARATEARPLAPGEWADLGADVIGVVTKGRLGRHIGRTRVDELGVGDFFGEEMSVFWAPRVFRLCALEGSEILTVPAAILADIPSVRWRLFEAQARRALTSPGSPGGVAGLVWSDGERIGEPRIDSGHRRLFELAAAVVEIARDDNLPAVAAALDALVEFAVHHFGDEESLLSRRRSRTIGASRRAHAEDGAVLTALRDAVAAGRRPVAEVAPALRDWLRRHVAGDRALFAPALRPPS
jgi:hemerythrin